MPPSSSSKRPDELKLGTTLRWLLGVVLLWAALGKVANVQEFYAALLAYQIPLPSALLKATAVVLPWLELLCGLMLLANVRTTAALAWAVVLFAVFAACTGQAWLRGLHIACGCLDLRLLGIAGDSALGLWMESAKFAFIRAALLLVVAVGLLARVKTCFAPPGLVPTSRCEK